MGKYFISSKKKINKKEQTYVEEFRRAMKEYKPSEFYSETSGSDIPYKKLSSSEKQQWKLNTKEHNDQISFVERDVVMCYIDAEKKFIRLKKRLNYTPHVNMEDSPKDSPKKSPKKRRAKDSPKKKRSKKRSKESKSDDTLSIATATTAPETKGPLSPIIPAVNSFISTAKTSLQNKCIIDEDESYDDEI